MDLFYNFLYYLIDLCNVVCRRVELGVRLGPGGDQLQQDAAGLAQAILRTPEQIKTSAVGLLGKIWHIIDTPL